MTSHQETRAGAASRPSTGHDGAEAPHKLPTRTLIAASVGNAVEWYDWTVYATFSIYFATQIFPAENESVALIGTFATYSLAFFFRPLGGASAYLAEIAPPNRRGRYSSFFYISTGTAVLLASLLGARYRINRKQRAVR